MHMSEELSDLSPSVNSDDRERETTLSHAGMHQKNRRLNSSSLNDYEESESDNGIPSLSVTSAINVYRIKYLCTRQSLSSFLQHSWNRIPSGKATYFILFLCFLERLSYYFAVWDVVDPFLNNSDLSNTARTLIKGVLLYMVAPLMFPFVGWLADVWIGRFRMICIGLCLMWLGYASVTLSFSLEYSKYGNKYLDLDHSNPDHDHYRSRYSLIASFLVINLGSAAFQANAIPFGADQIAYKSSEELSSYFYCYYWVRNFAFLLSVAFTGSNIGRRWYGIIFGFISAFTITIALSLNAICSKHFLGNIEKRNPVKTISNVFFSALVAKRPKHRSAFSYSGAKPPSRIDLTKQIHGGKFPTEDVEDTKTFGRLILLSMTIAGGLIVFSGEETMLHGNESDFRITLTGNHMITFPFLQTISLLVLLLGVPFMNSCIFPFLRDYTPNMLRRIGLGYILAILSIICFLVITITGQEVHRAEEINHENATLHTHLTCVFSNDASDHAQYVRLPISVHYMVIPNVLMIFAEIFLNISGLEFFYAQSPHTMRGMMIGIYFFVWGLSSALSSLILLAFSKISKSSPPGVTCQMWYYLLLLVVAVGYFVLYIFVARWYQNRKRLTEQEEEVFYRP